MVEKKKKNGVEISEEGQHIKIYISSFSTVIIVLKEDKLRDIIRSESVSALGRFMKKR